MKITNHATDKWKWPLRPSSLLPYCLLFPVCGTTKQRARARVPLAAYSGRLWRLAGRESNPRCPCSFSPPGPAQWLTRHQASPRPPPWLNPSRRLQERRRPAGRPEIYCASSFTSPSSAMYCIALWPLFVLSSLAWSSLCVQGRENASKKK
jgi:hypothetical protein